MKLKSIPLLFIVCAGLCFTCRGQETIIDTFFTYYEKQGIEKAVDYVFATNPWMNDSKEAITNIKLRLDKAVSLLGEYNGYELIIKQEAGTSYVLLSYLVKYSRQPIQFTFVLYKPDDKWQIQNLKFDDSIDDDLEKFPNLAAPVKR